AGIGTGLFVGVALRRVPEWRVRLLAGLLILGMLLALGEGTLLYRVLRSCFPVVAFVRYPVRVLLLVLDIALVLADVGLPALEAFWLDLVRHTPMQIPSARPSVYSPGLVNAQLKWNPVPRLGQSRAMLAPAALQVLKTRMLPDLEENYLQNRRAMRANCNLLD